jgi:hypothetical protein
MTINILKTSIVSFIRKTIIHFNYCVGGVSIIRTDCVNEPDITLYSKQHFHRHVDYIYFHVLKLLGFVRFIINDFSHLSSLPSYMLPKVGQRLSMCLFAVNLSLAESNKLETGNCKQKICKLMLQLMNIFRFFS